MSKTRGVFLAVLFSLMLVAMFKGCVATAEPYTDGWTKTYGGMSFDEARALVQTSDGGYALAGSTLSFGAGSSDFWLVKTDASGVIPEFPLHVILAALLVVTSLAVILSKRKFRGKTIKPC